MSFELSQDTTNVKNGGVERQGEASQDDLLNDFYTMKDNVIYKHRFKEGDSQQVYEITHCKQPKIAFTQKGRVFVMGGAKTQQNKELVNHTYEL